MGILTKETSDMLIRESKDYLRPYHINLRKYSVIVVQDKYDVTATVIFTSKVSGRNIYVECYYNDVEILQGAVHL